MGLKDAPTMAAPDLERALSLIGAVEALVTLSDPFEATARLSDARLEWAEFHADAEIDEPLTQQFEAACDAVREAIAERQRELGAELERAEALEREQADRVAICAEIETLSGEAALDRVAELRVRWDSLPPIPSEYAASLNRRFQDASRASETQRSTH